MKMRLFYLTLVSSLVWFAYTGFSPNDESPKWNQDPRTTININPAGTYTELPAGDVDYTYSNEIRYINTPEGVYAVGPNFRVHPTTARTQSETPITVHPLNPDIMFASANCWNVGGSTTISTGHYITTNGGVTWTGDDTTVFNFGDPAPMIMHTGRYLISYITSSGSMGASYSTNGTSWSSTVTFPGATTSADKNLSAVDGQPTSAYYGRCYTVYTEFAGANANRIVGTWSSNGGVTWSSVIPISPPPSPGHHHQGCDVTVDIFGWVRVTWANCTTNGQNSTEDSLGWAESGTGGTSWADQSNHKVNTNGIRTSDLLTPSTSVIRANGFPRIDGDKTCLPSNGDEYVVMAEKNFAPALDNADIVLMKTPDGGSSWTRTRVNQNPSGSYEWFPAVHVDKTGAINVVYYSTRNVPTNDSAQIYLSRSTNGGTSWVDILVSDHKFRPVPISGLAAGYQGDYIGITSGGDGKLFPYWCEQNPSTGGRYQAYTSMVDISMGLPACEDFSCNKDTGSVSLPVITKTFFEDFTGTNYWNRRSTASAFGLGSGSARFNSWSASGGTSQSLVSYDFAASSTNHLTFDHAYAPWSGGNVDSLIIETSNNSGATWSIFRRLWGGLGAAAGPLNTVFVGGGQFTPTASQWNSMTFDLPNSANKVRLRAVSGFGNDIWIDNVCIQSLPTSSAGTVGLAHQGMFIPSNPFWRLQDTIRIYLARTDYPNVIVDSIITTMGGNAVSNTGQFFNALSGNYYRVIKHRNCIRTWSNVGVALTRGSSSHHNFIQPDGQAFGNNQAVVSTSPFYRGMYTADVDQDAFVDGFDLLRIDNDAANFVGGYVVTDLTGDGFVDGTDFAIADNNAAMFVSEIAPPGAAPVYEPNVQDLQRQLAEETDASLRDKIQHAIQYTQDEIAKNSEKPKRMSYDDFLNSKNPDRVQTKNSSREKETDTKTNTVIPDQPKYENVDTGAGEK